MNSFVRDIRRSLEIFSNDEMSRDIVQHFAVRLPDATDNRHRAIVSKATLRAVFLRAFYYSVQIYRVSSKRTTEPSCSISG